MAIINGTTDKILNSNGCGELFNTKYRNNILSMMDNKININNATYIFIYIVVSVSPESLNLTMAELGYQSEILDKVR